MRQDALVPIQVLVATMERDGDECRGCGKSVVETVLGNGFAVVDLGRLPGLPFALRTVVRACKECAALPGTSFEDPPAVAYFSPSTREWLQVHKEWWSSSTTAQLLDEYDVFAASLESNLADPPAPLKRASEGEQEESPSGLLGHLRAWLKGDYA